MSNIPKQQKNFYSIQISLILILIFGIYCINTFCIYHEIHSPAVFGFIRLDRYEDKSRLISESAYFLLVKDSWANDLTVCSTWWRTNLKWVNPASLPWRPKSLVAIATVVTGCIISIAVRVLFRKTTTCSTRE